MNDLDQQDGALRELASDASSRKRFLKMVGGGGAATALGLLIAACGGDDEDSATSTTTSEPSGQTTTDSASGGGMEGDLKILNYALTLEYLEAQFYADVIASGVITDKALVEVAKQFGQTEQEHVDALSATVTQLGGTPAEKPNASFQSVIDGGAQTVLETAATVENLGAAAYLGQAGNIKNKEILASALAIHSVEARHAAALSNALGVGFKGDNPLLGTIPDGAFAKGMTEDEVLKAVQPFLQS